MTTGWQSQYPFAGGPEETGQDIQSRIERLEEWVCVLLLKNQRLRMALQVERTGAPSPSVAQSVP